MDAIPGLTSADLDIIKRCLQESLTPGQRVDVWLFGSRATGKHLPFSDIDLLIASKAGATFSGAQAQRVRDSLEESDLVFKCDIVRDEDLLPAFRPQVDRFKLPVWIDLDGLV